MNLGDTRRGGTRLADRGGGRDRTHLDNNIIHIV